MPIAARSRQQPAVPAPSPERPRVFLSSAFQEEIDGAPVYLPLRRRIIENRGTLPVDLWAYDIQWPAAAEPSPTADTIIDRCFDGIRDCDLFVFLLSGKHGTGTAYLPDVVHASYLELELFAAAMLQKPVLVLHQRGRSPDAALGNVLELLSRSFAADRYVVGDDAELHCRLIAECHALAAGARPASEPVLRRLADYLSRWRSNASIDAELAEPSLRFLGDRIRVGRAGDVDKARLLLDQVSSGKRGDAANRALLPHGATLFRLWTAMRELMEGDGVSDPLRASLWDRAFGLWGSHASWFGLHGHLWMGPLASVQSQIGLRRQFASAREFRSSVDAREPTGARASALYSVAQRMGTWRQRVRHFRMAAALATSVIDANPDRCEGALSIRGRTSLQLARLGYVWRLWDAERDFRRSLAQSEQAGSTGSSSQAMLDLGLCLVFTGRGSAGLPLLQQAVFQMRGDDSATGRAFLARGLRNLERGAWFARRRQIADAARAERLALAADIQAMDQTR